MNTRLSKPHNSIHRLLTVLIAPLVVWCGGPEVSQNTAPTAETAGRSLQVAMLAQNSGFFPPAGSLRLASSATIEWDQMRDQLRSENGGEFLKSETGTIWAAFLSSDAGQAWANAPTSIDPTASWNEWLAAGGDKVVRDLVQVPWVRFAEGVMQNETINSTTLETLWSNLIKTHAEAPEWQWIISVDQGWQVLGSIETWQKFKADPSEGITTQQQALRTAAADDWYTKSCVYQNKCGTYNYVGYCWCDYWCTYYGDCCWADYYYCSGGHY